MKIDNGFFWEEKKQQDTKTDYLKTAMQWAGTYANDVAFIEAMVFKSEPYRICVLDMYSHFVIKGELVKLENLTQQEKIEYWEETKRIFPDEATDTKRKQLCIFLYFMSFVFEKYFVA